MEEAAQVGVWGAWVGVVAFPLDCSLGSEGVGYLCVHWCCADGAADSCCSAGSAQGCSEAGEGGLRMGGAAGCLS